MTEESTSGAQQAVQEKGQQAKEQVQQATSSAKEQLQQATSSAQDKMRQQVDTRSTEAGHQVDSVAEAMRKASEHLSGQGNDLPAKAAEQVAQRAEQLGQYLRESDADKILGDLEDFARKQPLIVAAVGLAAGIAAARFLKASGQRRYRAQTQGSSYAGLTTTTYDPAVQSDPLASRYPTIEPEAATYPPESYPPAPPARTRG
ncbi:MAG: hypothetical protein DLM67_06900 [Candidatus Nephthysia bennettiae]|uniref:DUF3618 domain-containing protein n=1 Tax=Candidatus Nephthysia bennettiae TaxID=3127016 RepID=A0A934N7U6_9BACT|nr:hypothetical protein [Candidatus Dormibacteraeota bacterium]PZR97886.1 MAG: hypothetical protein DLM67_06900 [Candidatus Dormibacteraeota bacterium]